MTEGAVKTAGINQGFLPVNNFPPNRPAAAYASAAPSVSIKTPEGSRIYEYPQTSIYSGHGRTPAQGVNIYVVNPAGYSSGLPGISGASGAMPAAMLKKQGSDYEKAIANTSVKDDNESEKTGKAKGKKQKKIIQLTDNYIRTLESYIRSRDKTVRKQGIEDLINRFEEDDSRYENEPLTALLNIALQDADTHNRILAMTILAAGSAHGDENTVRLLKQLVKSDKMYGQEASIASKALLKTSHSLEAA